MHRDREKKVIQTHSISWFHLLWLSARHAHTFNRTLTTHKLTRFRRGRVVCAMLLTTDFTCIVHAKKFRHARHRVVHRSYMPWHTRMCGKIFREQGLNDTHNTHRDNQNITATITTRKTSGKKNNENAK